MIMFSPIKFDKVALRGIFTMKFEEFYQQLTDQLNQATAGSDNISQEAKVYLRAATSNLFKKLDIVSKEEFEAQKAVLTRSREKINQLEQQLEQLQQLMDSAK
jgi:ubiquinone biosynthesis accessory factor UbiK